MQVADAGQTLSRRIGLETDLRTSAAIRVLLTAFFVSR